MPQVSTRKLLVFLLALALFYSGWKFSAWSPQWIDLPMGDEADYLFEGVTLDGELGHGVGQLLADWSPFYSLWYHALAKVSPDRVALYYLNYRLTGALLVMFLFLVLERWGAHPWGALGFAFLVLIGRLPWIGVQRVTTFSLMVLLGSLWILALAPTALRLWVGVWLLWLAAFARPEYLLAAVLLAGYALWAHRHALTPSHLAAQWAQIRASKRALAWVILPPLVALTLTLIWGVPTSQKRSIYAFKQHYALTQSFCVHQRHGATWEEEARYAFGDADTWPAILQRNPQAVWRHVWCNVTSILKDTRYLSTVFYHAPLLWPKAPTDDQAGQREAKLLVLLTGLGLLYRLAHPTSLKQRWEALRNAHWLPVWGVVFLATLPVVIAVYSAIPHYRIMPLTPLVLLLGVVLLPRKGASLPWGPSLGLALLVVAATPPFAWLFPSPLSPPSLPNQATVRAIANVAASKEGPLRIALTHPIHYDLLNYLSRPWEELPYLPDEGFLDFVAQTQPDLMVVDLSHFHGDDGWEAFAQDPTPYGYWRLSLSGDRLIFGRQGVVAPP